MAQFNYLMITQITVYFVHFYCVDVFDYIFFHFIPVTIIIVDFLFLGILFITPRTILCKIDLSNNTFWENTINFVNFIDVTEIEEFFNFEVRNNFKIFIYLRNYCNRL